MLPLIFDMDGVVVDSNPYHRRAWAAYNRRFGIDTDESMQQFMYGRRNDEIIRDFFGGDLTAEEISAHDAGKEELFRELIGPSICEALVPGIREFLECRRGLPLALATNAGPANVAFLIEAAGLEGVFRAVVDGSQVANPKPHPDIYLRAAQLLGADPGGCVVFEDSFSGIAAARAAGMRVVGLKTTHAKLPDVDLAIDNFDSPELEPWLLQA